ncbi:MAG: transcriptional repressor LexA [Candidatus Hydrogenedentes bacterium]|nr:transcriptional repressor LexA [Candidatus Hydrogenedentota bacterium]
MTATITTRQQKVLEYIADIIETQGYPPTIQEIGRHFGIVSTNGVYDHLKTLEKKGYIERSPKARSIRLTQKAMAMLRRAGGPALPLVGRVAAGAPLLAMENIEEYVPVRSHLAERDAFCLRVAGDSMIEAGILAGDIIVVDRSAKPRPGDIVVALIDGEATVKYLYPRSDTVELRPANQSMKSLMYPAVQVEVQGVVVALQRNLESGRVK